MKGMKVTGWYTLLTVLCLLLATASVEGQLIFTTNNGAITITGYTGTSGDVVIPASIDGYPVKRIGEYAFSSKQSLTNVSIPNTVTNIERLAFLDSGLKSIAIPDGVINISQSAFANCRSLADVTFGIAVQSIEDDAFYGCTSLTKVFIPSNLTNIYSTAFVYCTSLTNFDVAPFNPVFSSVSGVLLDKIEAAVIRYPAGRHGNYTFPSSVSSIGDNAFEFCFNLTNTVLSDAITNIGRYAFYGCNNATNFTLSSSLQTVGDYAFSSCSKLSSIVIPTNVQSIGRSSFSSTALTSVLLPASATNVASSAFSYCYNLNAINVAMNNPAYVSVTGILFTSNLTKLVKFPILKSGTSFQPTSYVIPTGITTIEEEAFRSCMFSNVVIPSSVTSIGRYAFDDCFRLTSILLPNGLAYIGFSAFAGTGITNLTVPGSVAIFEGFGGWSNLRNIYFLGDAPSRGTNNYVQAIITGATVYYLPGTLRWGTKLFGVPTAPWLPTLQGSSGSLINQSNQFSFNINWASGRTVVVETSTNLPPAAWLPLATNTLTGSSANFTDAEWRNYPVRFYRVRMQ